MPAVTYSRGAVLGRSWILGGSSTPWWAPTACWTAAPYSQRRSAPRSTHHT